MKYLTAFKINDKVKLNKLGQDYVGRVNGLNEFDVKKVWIDFKELKECKKANGDKYVNCSCSIRVSIENKNKHIINDVMVDEIELVC